MAREYQQQSNDKLQVLAARLANAEEQARSSQQAQLQAQSTVQAQNNEFLARMTALQTALENQTAETRAAQAEAARVTQEAREALETQRQQHASEATALLTQQQVAQENAFREQKAMQERVVAELNDTIAKASLNQQTAQPLPALTADSSEWRAAIEDVVRSVQPQSASGAICTRKIWLDRSPMHILNTCIRWKRR